jgi:hypothetical protein
LSPHTRGVDRFGDIFPVMQRGFSCLAELACELVQMTVRDNVNNHRMGDTRVIPVHLSRVDWTGIDLVAVKPGLIERPPHENHWEHDPEGGTTPVATKLAGLGL